MAGQRGYAPDVGTPQVIDGRWEVLGVLGAGGSGCVWRVRASGGGRELALKLVRTRSAAQRGRFRRELEALRSLRIEGVVPLVDVGEHLGEPYLVMEVVAGSPFPGRDVPRTWVGIASRCEALLEILAQVHAAGLVHRDLKPDNILVDDDGRVTLLDFGLARTVEPGATATGTGAGPVGTPRYLAPEQLLSLRCDARADLYAVGVMLYELLSGRPPHPDEHFWTRLIRRMTPAAVSLGEVAPEVEPSVVAVVDRLLAPQPEERPPSALAVLAALRERVPFVERPGPRELPLIGRELEVLELCTDVRCGVSRDVWGTPGSGRTRLVREVTLRLRGEGREVVPLKTGKAPLSSLQAALGPPTSADVLAEMASRLRDRLGAGLIVVITDPGVDSWSRRLVDEARGFGAVLRVQDTPGAMRLEPLLPDALMAVFHGPDCIFHVREDAATELHERTGGIPARIVGELHAWVSAGLGAWEAGRLRVSRVNLERLRGGLRVGAPTSWLSTDGEMALDPATEDVLAWVVLGGGVLNAVSLTVASGLPDFQVALHLMELEARGYVRRRGVGRLVATLAPLRIHELEEEELLSRHRAIAGALPLGSAERLRHWTIAGAEERIAREAGDVARGLIAEARLGAAVSILAAAWPAAEARLGEAEVEAFAELWVEVVIEGGDPGQVEGAGRALGGPSGPRPTLTGLLASYGRLQAAGDAAGAVSAKRLPVFRSPGLEAQRLALVFGGLLAAGRAPASFLAEPGVDEAAPLRERRESWRGRAAYARGDFEQAAAHHARSAELATTARRRLVSMVNEGAARLDADQPQAALSLGMAVVLEATALRLPQLEGWARGVVRCARYRLGEDLASDAEWVVASRQLGPPQRHAHACLVEAACHWRRGDRDGARALAEESAGTYLRLGQLELWVLPEALRLVVGGTADRSGRARLTAAIKRARAPRFALQADALRASAYGGRRLHDPLPEQLFACIPPASTRWDVLSVPEEPVELPHT